MIVQKEVFGDAVKLYQENNFAESIALLSSRWQEGGILSSDEASLLYHQCCLVGEFDKIDQHFQSVKPDTHLTLCYADALMKNSAHSAAMAQIQKAVKSITEKNSATSQSISAPVIKNLAHLLYSYGFYNEAITFCNLVLNQFPLDVEALHNRAHAHLSMGNLAEGFADYRWRFEYLTLREQAAKNPSYVQKDLSGSVNGLTQNLFDLGQVSIRYEQGIGEELMFLRFNEEVAKKGWDVTYHMSEKLNPLLARCTQLPLNDSQIGFSFCHIGDIPYLLSLSEEIFIPPSLSLAPKQSSLDKIKARIAQLKLPLVGMTWRAGCATQGPLLAKAVPLETLLKALKNVEATIVVLQKDLRDDEVTTLNSNSHDWVDLSDCFDDLEDSLAVQALLNEYVTVSNTNVHLREALGRPSHVLVPFPYEYRWPANQKSPWFPRSEVYHEAIQDNWESSVTLLNKKLRTKTH